jgi:acyl dehydratase
MRKKRRCFEDFAVGERIELGSRTVTREEILGFARQYDAQPMHVDEEAARHSMLGGLGASGWHTAAVFMRLLCDGLLLEAASLGSPGIDKLAWVKPVRPGDRLTAVGEVVETRASRSRPDMGVVRFRFTVTNGADETVMTIENPIMFQTRGASA